MALAAVSISTSSDEHEHWYETERDFLDWTKTASWVDCAVSGGVVSLAAILCWDGF